MTVNGVSDFSEKLEEVENVHNIVRNLASKDEDVATEAIKKADEYLRSRVSKGTGAVLVRTPFHP